MSGPVDKVDVPDVAATDEADPPCIQITPSRDATVGRLTVRRALPRRERRTVGAWCFVDHMVPLTVSEHDPVEIGPHPHVGLHTVTWLVQGEMLHLDSLDSEQLLRPGQLNLMTAGNGVAHSESSEHYAGAVHGVQLWVAQPQATRFAEPAFEHHADLPKLDLDSAVATVIVGAVDGAVSPARADTPMVGVDLDLRRGVSALPLRSDFEHAIVVLDGAVHVDEQRIEPGALAYLGLGRQELVVSALDPARVLLIGGEPFPEQVLMWWNFVARSRDEVDAARVAWQQHTERFRDTNWTLPRVAAPDVPWAREH